MLYLLRRSRALLVVGGLAVASVTGLVAAVPAGAAVRPVVPVAPEPAAPGVPSTAPTLTSLNSAMWQTNGTVWSLAYANVGGGRVFAGGTFDSVRPPGASAGDPASRTAFNIAAFKTADGTLDTTFTHQVSGQVSAMTVSPDGRTLYIGGQFVKVDNDSSYYKIAAFDLTRPGYPLISAWKPAVGGVGLVGVRAITVSADSETVYVGGGFTSLGGVPLINLGRVTSATSTTPGVVDPAWSPTFDANTAVNALLLAPSTNSLIVGGNFETVNGVARRALAAVDTSVADGRTNGPLDALITTCGLGCKFHSDIKALTTDGTNVFAAAEGTGGGWFDGTLAFNPVTGRQVWKDNCLGATQAIAVVGGVLYGGSHAHDCSAIRGFGQATLTTGGTSGANTGPSSWHHLMGEQTSNGALLDWFPTTNAGPTDGKAVNELGPRALVSDGANLYVAGQFTTVNGAAQQGITRFMAGSARAKPVAVSSAFGSLQPGGKAVLMFAGSWDPDSSGLTYRVYRDGGTTPIATIGPVQAHFWRSPQYVVRDSGLTAGPHYYEIDAVDEAGGVTRSGRITVSATVSGNYPATVKAAGPTWLYWRLGEFPGNTVAADASGYKRNGTYSGALNVHILSAVPGNSAIHLGTANGQFGNVFSAAAATNGPNRFAVGLWIRTNTSRGGQIIGFGNSQNGSSTKSDRVLYMTNSGQLIYGTNGAAGQQYLWTPQSYNDGTWHYVVMNMDSSLGMRLYIDGNMVASNPYATSGAAFKGWWRLGPDTLAGWPQRPANAGFVGDIDEVMVQSNPLNGTPMRTIMTSQ